MEFLKTRHTSSLETTCIWRELITKKIRSSIPKTYPVFRKGDFYIMSDSKRGRIFRSKKVKKPLKKIIISSETKVVIGTKKFVSFGRFKKCKHILVKSATKKVISQRRNFSATKWQIPKTFGFFGNNLFWVHLCTKLCS